MMMMMMTAMTLLFLKAVPLTIRCLPGCRRQLCDDAVGACLTALTGAAAGPAVAAAAAAAAARRPPPVAPAATAVLWMLFLPPPPPPRQHWCPAPVLHAQLQCARPMKLLSVCVSARARA
ncbi:hypothetical protein JKP88DRAFT_225047 [Tribonema minus]|uniref:Secreted protein n=1 Tax=Tribonema minus TaxID=303371 RepID=A0A835YP13_9STRA|nr:hypothetical protein JKP88DRAFT_225047 [Tribonema minus]